MGKPVPSFWWDFVWYRDINGSEQSFIIVESDIEGGAEYIRVSGIEHAEKMIADLNAGRMTWPK